VVGGEEGECGGCVRDGGEGGIGGACIGENLELGKRVV